MTKRVFNAGFYASPEKEERRQFMCSLTGNINKALILGGKFMKDGKMLAGKFPTASIISLERDPEIYEIQLKESRRYPTIFPKNVDFSTYLKSMEQDVPFDLVFLDFNCILGVRREDEIDEMFKLRFDKNAIIIITFSIGRDSADRIKKTFSFQVAGRPDYEWYKKNRPRVISQGMVALAKRNGYRLKPLEMPFPTTYQNTSLKGRKRGQSMIFLPFKVVGGTKK